MTNNTQQAGEATNMVRKEFQHLISIFNTVLVEWDGKEFAMVDICVECMRRIESSQAAPTPAPDAVEAKVAEKARLYLEDFCKPIYYHSENCHKAALLSYLAGHAEGQKATVQAKSAGVWQLCPKCNGQGTVSRPPWISEGVRAFVSSETGFECNLCKGKMIIPQDAGTFETPASHAEGEKGAVEDMLVRIINRFRQYLVDGECDFTENLKSQIKNYAKAYALSIQQASTK